MSNVHPIKHDDVKTNEWMDAADLAQADIPEIDYLIDGILPAGSCGDVSGEPGGGKTSLLMSLMLHLAAGKHEWFGRRITSGPVMILGGEKSSRAVWIRDLARAGAREMDLECGRFIIPPFKQGALWEWAAKGKYWEKTGAWNAVTSIAKDLKPTLVVGDTIGRMALGQDPLDIPQQQRLAMQLEELRDVIGCTLITLSHTNQASKKESIRQRLDYISRSGGNGLPGHMRWLCGVTRLNEKEVAAVLGLDPNNADDAFEIETRRFVAVGVSKDSEMPRPAWTPGAPAILEMKADGRLEMFGTQSVQAIDKQIEESVMRKKMGKGPRSKNGIGLEKGHAESEKIKATHKGNNNDA